MGYPKIAYLPGNGIVSTMVKSNGIVPQQLPEEILLWTGISSIASYDEVPQRFTLYSNFVHHMCLYVYIYIYVHTKIETCKLATSSKPKINNYKKRMKIHTVIQKYED